MRKQRKRIHLKTKRRIHNINKRPASSPSRSPVTSERINKEVRKLTTGITQKIKTISKKIFGGNAKLEAFVFNLLPDKPISADHQEDIRFGHEVIAQSIREIVANVNDPLTIGLFGKWGTGKSTIINITRKLLKEDDVKSVVFDAWKYEADSLRRQFLITLDEELGLNLNYKKTLNQSISIPQTLNIVDQFKINKFNFLLVPVILTVVFFLLSIAGYFKFISPGIAETAKEYNILGIIFSSLFSAVIGSMKMMTATIQQNKTDSAEGFEYRFYDEVLDKVGESKLLIIIDNLDRTQSEAATKLLSDIKTFLSNDSHSISSVEHKVVFLIACDAKAIIKHLENCNFDNPEEFLRKFFNASLTIPLFLDVELDHYTEDLIKKTNVKEFEDDQQLVWLITYAFRDNPREIKQFINTLTTHYVLVKNMIRAGEIITGDSILNNISFLAKLLIIRQKYPRYFDSIEYHSIREGYDWENIEFNQHSLLSDSPADPSEKDVILKKQFIDFMYDTKYIKSDNLAVFIRLRQSKEEREFTQWKTLQLSCIDKNDEVAGYIIKSIKSENDYEKLDRLANVYVREDRRSSPRGEIHEKLLTFGLTFIRVAKDRINKFPLFLNEFVSSLEHSNNLKHKADELLPNIYFDYVFPVLKKQNRVLLLSTFVSIIKPSESKETDVVLPLSFTKGLFAQIQKHQDIFEDKQKEIMDYISKRYSDLNYLEAFVQGTPSLRSYISDNAKEAYLSTIDKADLGDVDILKRKLDLMNKLYE